MSKMEVFSQTRMPLKSSKVNLKRKVRTSLKRKKRSFCSCCNRPLNLSLPCDGKFLTLDSSRKFRSNNLNNYHNASFSTDKTVTSEAEQKCKCIEQVLCKSSNPRVYSKSTNSDQNVTLDQVQYLCGTPSNLALKSKNYHGLNSDDKDSGNLQINNNESMKGGKNLEKEFKIVCTASSNCCFVDSKLEKLVEIIQEKFYEELKNRKKVSIICCPLKNNSDVSTFYQPCESFSFSSNSLEMTLSSDDGESINETCCKDLLKESQSSHDKEDSLITLLDLEGNICFDECKKDKKWNCVKRSRNQEINGTRPKVMACGQTIKICKRRAPIILRHCDHYQPHSCFHDHVEPFKLGHLGKSDEIGKWGKCLDLVDQVLAARDERSRFSESPTETEKGEICFRDGTCIDDFDNVNRFKGIGNFGFSIFCRKLMRWTNCVTKMWRETKKYPHVVVHLPSFACADDLRCRAMETYQSLQNIQIGRLGWLENETSQVLYVCPDNMNLDVCLLRKLVSVARPDINLDNLWLVKPEKRDLKKSSSGCENLFLTPVTYRRVRYLTAGRQAFILPGIMDEKDVLIACELKIAILGPCLKFQNRLLSKNYAMNVLHEAKIDQPPFIGVKDFKDLCSNLAIIILKYPIYKLWFIKIDRGHHGYQTAIYQINEKLYKKINQTRMNEEELKSKLVARLPKELQLKEEIYRNSTEFFDGLQRHGGIVQACPNQKYHVISLGLFNEHDTAKPLLITTADVIQFEKDIRTNIGYIIPDSKISNDALEKLTDKVGKAVLQEQYIGFYGVDIVAFKNESNVQKLWVINLKPFYTDLLSFNDWKMFCSKQCKCCPPPKVKNYAVCSGKLYISGLSKYCGEQLMTFCEAHNIYYDHKEKSGCMLYPIDSENRAMFIFSLHTNRKIAIKKFIEALRTLPKLSLENLSGKLKTNMHQLAKELEKNELGNSITQ